MRRLKILSWVFGIMSILCLSSGCQSQTQRLVLPEGNIELGQDAFVRLSCTQCHSIKDVAWTGIELEGDVHVKLAPRTEKPIGYDELVTSIINPNFKIARRHLLEMTTKDWHSRMRRYNEVMTVEDLINVVAFIQHEYDIDTPPAGIVH